MKCYFCKKDYETSKQVTPRGARCPECLERLKQRANETYIEKYGSLERFYELRAKKTKAVIDQNPNFYKERTQKSNLRRISKFGSLDAANQDKWAKCKTTLLATKGITNNFQREDVKDKIKDTNLEKYGVANPMQNEQVKRKARNTVKAKKREDPSYIANIVSKRELTSLDRYGVPHHMMNPEVSRQIRQVLLDKYGVGNPSQIPGVAAKVKSTILDKFGSYSSTVTPEIRRQRRAALLEANCLKYKDIDFSLKGMTYIEGVSPQVKCIRCEGVYPLVIAPSQVLQKLYCPICKPLGSVKERFLVNYLETKGVTVIQHDRSILEGKELDIYIPELNLAIEFDGLYWHSENNGVASTYHRDKTSKCLEKGIHLIHIWEHELATKQALVLSMLDLFLGETEKIFARKCEIREISFPVYREFMLSNHLQGSVSASVRLGLYWGGSLVAAMSLGKSRYNKNYEWELLRYCELQGTHTLGGKGKLLKHFEREYKPASLLSYCDLRWFKGSSYVKLGFTRKKDSPPNYFYFRDGNMVFSRQMFQKHKLKALPEFEFHEDLTEVENMRLNGFNRIFDCGNSVYVKQYS
jgi:predicted transcriptional regulator